MREREGEREKGEGGKEERSEDMRMGEETEADATTGADRNKYSGMHIPFYHAHGAKTMNNHAYRAWLFIVKQHTSFPEA